MNNNHWNGFVYESKQFMSYDHMSRGEKSRFWWQFPRKAFKFYLWYPMNDKTRKWYMRALWKLNFIKGGRA